NVISAEMTHLLVPVSDDLRGVFDRMLAAEDAIVAAKEATSVPLFDTKPESMTDAEWAINQRVHADADALAGAALLKQLLGERHKTATAAWQERRGTVEAEVRTEVEAEPIQQVVSMLKRGVLPGETTDTPPSEVIKLAKALLVGRYGDGVTKTLPSGTFSVQGGVDPDVIAIEFGMKSGDELITALQNYEPLEDKVARVTDERMEAEFPDLLGDSPALADAAQAALHRAPTDAALVEDLKALGRSDSSIPPTNVFAVKALALEVIADTPVRDLSPFRYQQAEQKASRLAREALRKGELTTAAFHQRQALLNHMLYRYANEALALERRALKFAGRMGTASMRERLGLAGPAYLNTMDGLLTQYEFVRLSLRALDRRASLATWVAERKAEGLPVEVPIHVLEDAAQRNYRTLTVNELQGVYDTMKQIHHLATNKGKLLDAKRKRDAQSVEDEILGSIGRHHEMVPRVPDYAPTLFSKAGKFLSKVDAWHMKPEFLFTWLDGESHQGPVWQALFAPIAEAENLEHLMLEDALPKLQALFERIPKERRKALLERLIVVPGSSIRMTGATALSLGMNWGNMGNREAVAAGTIDGQPHLTPEQIQFVLGTLTGEEWRMIQATWDFIGDFWPEIAALQERLVGVAPERVEATPFTVTSSDGQVIAMKGGYYPLAYDGEFSATQRKQDAAAAVQELVEWGYAKATTKHGHTIARTASGGRAVKLDLSVLTQHVLNVIHDLSHREAVLNVQRVVERSAVQSAIEQTAGKEMYDTINPWLKRIASDRQPVASPVESIMGRARTGVTVVNMGLKVTTAVVQPLGFLQSIDLIGAKYARRGMQAFLTNPAKIWKHVQEASVAMRHRQESFDRDVRDLSKRLGEPTSLQTAFFYFTAMADFSVAVPTWYGAYLKSMEVLVPGDHDAAVAYGDQAVRMSQSAGTAKDLARIQGGGEMQRSFTTFYSYFSVLYNLMRRSSSQLKNRGVSDVPRFIGSMALLWFLPSILSEYVAQRGPEDDEDWMQWATWELIRYPLSSVVGVRDMASALGPEAYNYELSPSVEAIRSAVESLNILGGTGVALYKEGEPDLSRWDVKTLIEATGYWGKLPSRQMWITGSYLFDWMMGDEEPETPVEAARNLMFRR
ncbi:MAG TPA: hypothetical protein VM285_09400, partial [Polyangia bacterium]|nr:hypothetical protein [Polyangia bacterium]